MISKIESSIIAIPLSLDNSTNIDKLAAVKHASECIKSVFQDSSTLIPSRLSVNKKGACIRNPTLLSTLVGKKQNTG